MQIILNWTGRPGAGKTHSMLAKMVAEPGKYVLACPRIELIDEREKDLRNHANIAGTDPLIIPVHSENGRLGSVTRQLLENRDECRSHSHVILATTHQALIQSDLTGFSGWHARLDEVPSSVKAGRMNVAISSKIFPDLFDLEPIETSGWSKLNVKPGVTNVRSIQQDDLLNGVAEMHALAEQQGSFCNVTDWTTLQVQPLQWVSVWTLRRLSEFDSCEIAAASYQHTLGHLVMQSCSGADFQVVESPVPPRLTSSIPEVEVNYFTRMHRGSTRFWETDEGKIGIQAVARHLAGEQIGYWSCNDGLAAHFSNLGGEYVTPKSEGTNSLSHHTSCAFIYSSKAQPADSALTELFDISREQILRARETEDVFQFVLRGAIRDPSFGSVYRVWLYELEQAEVLKSMLEASGINVTLNPVEVAGIMDVVRARKGGRPKSLASKADRVRARRAADRARKQATRAVQRKSKMKKGILRRPGRPKKITS